MAGAGLLFLLIVAVLGVRALVVYYHLLTLNAVDGLIFLFLLLAAHWWGNYCYRIGVEDGKKGTG